MNEKYIRLIPINIFVAIVFLILFYILIFKDIKKIRNKRKLFIDYLKDIKDEETIYELKRNKLVSKKVIILINKYSETDDVNYFIYAIEYFFRARKLTYILFLLAVLILINLYLFIK